MKAIALLAVLAVLIAPAAAQDLTDPQILNFALNLEYLEAEFYSCAATGQPLPDELRGGGPASTGCEKAKLGAAAQAYAEEIANDEMNHVKFLRTALGDDAVAIPELNIGTAFSAAADAAAGSTLEPPISPYASDLFFYHGAFIFEDVGVTAYIGAAPLISNSTYLSAAASILAVEGYHAGIIRTLLYQSRDKMAYNLTVTEIVEAISDLRDSVDGDSDDDQGIVKDTNGTPGSDLVPVDKNGLAFARTPEQVIEIVTLGQGAGGGGFYPKGLNGFNSDSSS